MRSPFGGQAKDRVGAVDFAPGPRVALSFAILYCALGALLLRPVDERRRDYGAARRTAYRTRARGGRGRVAPSALARSSR